jgi:hypothetical protein
VSDDGSYGCITNAPWLKAVYRSRSRRGSLPRIVDNSFKTRWYPTSTHQACIPGGGPGTRGTQHRTSRTAGTGDTQTSVKYCLVDNIYYFTKTGEGLGAGSKEQMPVP